MNSKITDLIARVKDLRVVRASMRYGSAQGGLLSGGIAYAGMFAIAAALTITWTVFMAVLGGNEELKGSVLSAINDALPGILTTENSTGLIDPDVLVLDSALNPPSVIAAASLLWVSMSVMTALATSVRQMFRVIPVAAKPWVQYLRSLGGFIVLALGVLATAIVTTLVGTAGRQVLDALNIHGALASFGIRAAGLLVSFGIDMLVIVFLITVMSGVRVPRRDLLLGAAVAAVGTSALRVLGTAAVGSVADNPLLASFAAIITLLLWLNLAARIFLNAAAFMANPPAPGSASAEETHATSTPNYITRSAPWTLEWDHNPLTGAIVPQPVPAAIPEWKGWTARRLRRKAERAEREAIDAVAKALQAHQAYADGARAASAGQERTKDHTSDARTA